MIHFNNNIYSNVNYDDFIKEIQDKYHLKRIHYEKYNKHFQYLIGNLYKAYLSNEPLIISLAQNHYKDFKRYILKRIIDFLKEKEYIKVKLGVKRVLRTELTVLKLPYLEIKQEKSPLIIFKDKNKNIIEKKINKYLARQVHRLNYILNENNIIYKGQKLHFEMYRVFNRSSYKYGGRFYGGLHLLLSKKERSKITINDQIVQELDYSELFITILYAKNKLKFKDAYYISGYPRKLIKKSLNIMLNAKNKLYAIKAINKLNYNVDAQVIVDLLLEKHFMIKDMFFNPELGLLLQREESLLAEKIIKYFLKLNKVILPIHDGYLCSIEDKDLLRKVMSNAFYQKYKIRIKIT